MSAVEVPQGCSFAYLFERFPSFVQTFVYREAAEMVRQGVRPLLLSIRRPEDALAVAAEFTDTVHYLPAEKALRAEVDSWVQAGQVSRRARKTLARHRSAPDSQRIFEAVWLARFLKRAGIKHVHAHFGGMAARTAWWLQELYGIRYSFTGHANDIFCDTDFPVTNEQLARGARFVVTETDFARRWMEQKYPGLAGRVVRVFNGMDVSRFAPPAAEPSIGEFQVLSVGRYVEKKGFGDLIEACRMLRAEGRQFRCGIVGEGPLRETLARQIQEAGLGDVVELLGSRPQQEVQALVRSAKIFVLACIPEADGGSDNLPTVIMEAMLCGTPVVSTNLAGVPEMVDHERDGLLVAPHEPRALAAALARLLDAPAECERMRATAFQAAREKFAIERSARELKHLLVHRARVVPPESARALDPSLPPPPKWWQRWLR